MRKIPYAVVLGLFAASLSGCSGTDDGPSAYIDEVHIYVDGSFSDETLCQEALVLSSGEYYACGFTLTADAWLGIELEVASGSPSVDLITMSDLNFQKWEDGEEYYYLPDISDFATSGGSYSSNGNVEAGDYVMVVAN